MAHKTIRKFRLDNPTVWSHHRGGWTYAVQQIEQHLCCQDGVLLISSVEDTVADEKIVREPWVGFVHQVTKNNYPYFPDLERLVNDATFLESLKTCRGLFTLSSIVKNYLTDNVPDIPVARILYPATPSSKLFDVEKWSADSLKSIVFVGEFMRNFQFFFDISLPQEFSKKLVLSPDVNLSSLGIVTNNSVEIVDYLSESDYDEMLSTSVVLLNMFDAPANTTVVECITRNTPLIINRLPGLEEYLGKEYPLFYDSEVEAISLITSESKVREGHEYLINLSIKSSLTAEKFVKAIVNTSIYRCLDIPESQRSTENTRFPQYDLSVVICSYKRVYNMRRLLQCFVDQNTDKTFEVIVWNNNFEARDELQAICDDFKDLLHLKVTHSTENYYCIIRLAVAGLMRSDIMVICDDDVVPTPEFLKVYMDKFTEYGPEAVICCRGHRWWQHELVEETPELSWTEYDNLRFFDESHPDVKVHFVHADTCLIPKRLLLAAIQYPLPSYDTILVDDYWLSFVLSHRFAVPLWKIKGDTLFSSTPCAEDAKIALYLNERVREERIRMYIYHMRHGWPNNVIDREERDPEDTSAKYMMKKMY